MDSDTDLDDDLAALEAPYLKVSPDPLTAQTGLDAEGRRARASKAAQARWAKAEPADHKAVAMVLREATLEKFRDQVDPERLLPEAERDRLAHEAWSAHLRLKAQIQWARRKAVAAAEAQTPATDEVVA